MDYIYIVYSIVLICIYVAFSWKIYNETYKGHCELKQSLLKANESIEDLNSKLDLLAKHNKVSFEQQMHNVKKECCGSLELSWSLRPIKERKKVVMEF